MSHTGLVSAMGVLVRVCYRLKRRVRSVSLILDDQTLSTPLPSVAGDSISGQSQQLERGGEHNDRGDDGSHRIAARIVEQRTLHYNPGCRTEGHTQANNTPNSLPKT